MIDVKAAKQLLDLGARIGQGHRSEEQLRGAVAVHNILSEHRVAYLADEVGMGKTYVALGALALFRHYNPGFRVLVLAPRENIQHKWQKELTNFVAHNMRFPDLRVAALDRRPARPLVSCGNLLHFVHEVTADPNRDFFLRMSSFSLSLDRSSQEWHAQRDALRQYLPWLPREVFDLRRKEAFKDDFARAICCALPVFDLIIVDEAHHLKHGFAPSVAARNRMLALAMGHPSEREASRTFRGYGPRARRVLFLSATPLEETWRHVWNQLDVFGLGDAFSDLKRDDLTDEQKKEVARRFLIRRVTAVRCGTRDYTKNQYRREWRRGGVYQHDEPIRVEDDRQRLIVALVQKKVSELLGSERFKASFQIGMLASFESFLETTRLKRTDDTEEGNFDDREQTDDEVEREGIDVRDINRLARDYRKTFDAQLPHPKMDAVVRSLADSWRTGRKALVFVRRVASVKELKQKLDELYDEWLIGHLRERLPSEVRERFESVGARYRNQKRDADVNQGASPPQPAAPGQEAATEDRGGLDTFFEWFFRGTGPRGVVSGANVQRRFLQAGAVYATFFEDNHVMELLGARPGQVRDALARELKLETRALQEQLRQRAAKYAGSAQKLEGAQRLEAAQAAALELIKEGSSELSARARIIWNERYAAARKPGRAREAPDVSDWLEQPTFFTELRRPDRAELRARLWPEPVLRDSSQESFRLAFRERELRAQLLATAARLGHAFIDLYILTIRRLGSLDLRTQERDDEQGSDPTQRRIDAYLDLLEQQRLQPRAERGWGAFDELAELAEHFHLVLDVNIPNVRTEPLGAAAGLFGTLLRQQQPVGGMAGQVNRTLLQQFRMPGYPLVLVTTDLLQEGEDLHTFCSSIYHYGISWTPSAMEQRIGRIDRVRSQTDRRLTSLPGEPAGEDLLQVFFPHLEDTVELLQVRRVLERMNVFLRLMHEGLAPPRIEERRLDVGRELVRGQRPVEVIRESLRSAFPVPHGMTEGPTKTLAVSESIAAEAQARFLRLRESPLELIDVEWAPESPPGALLGTVKLTTGRVQPFTLLLRSDGGRLTVRCISPVGRVGLSTEMDTIAESCAARPMRLGALLTGTENSYDLTVEDDVLLSAPEHDASRIGLLLTRVVAQADELERTLLDKDEPLGTFADDLKKEGARGS